MHTWRKMWPDDRGVAATPELILLATLIAIGLLAGIAAVRDGVVSELSDVAGAAQDISQSYSVNGVARQAGTSSGSSFVDRLDFCDSTDDPANAADNCVQFSAPPTDELPWRRFRRLEHDIRAIRP